MSREPTDRDLVRLHWPPALRPAFNALFDVDDAMASVVARATQPALAAIKLAWWRERLQELDSGAVPAEPRLQAVAAELLPRGISGAELAELAQGWTVLLDEHPNAETALERGAALFRLASRLLGPDHPRMLDLMGRVYAAAHLRRRGLAPAELFAVTRWPRVPWGLRPLSALAVLARRDIEGNGPPFEPEGTPGRSWTLLRHHLTGR